MCASIPVVPCFAAVNAVHVQRVAKDKRDGLVPAQVRQPVSIGPGVNLPYLIGAPGVDQA